MGNSFFLFSSAPTKENGWGAGIRTPISRSRDCCLAIRRHPMIKKMAGSGGFEPPNAGTKTLCLATWRRPTFLWMAERQGFEPWVRCYSYTRLAGAHLKPTRSPLQKEQNGGGWGTRTPKGRARRFSRPLPYQLGLILHSKTLIFWELGWYIPKRSFELSTFSKNFLKFHFCWHILA